MKEIQNDLNEFINYFNKNKKNERWVIYSKDIEATKITADWYLWIHHTTNTIPDRKFTRFKWQKNHLENKIVIAQNLYEKVLKIYPNHSRALNNLGILSYNLNNNDQAIEYFQKAIDVNPLEADAYNNLGTIFKNLNKSLSSTFLQNCQ